MNGLIMHIVGNRPQFIKLAPVSREIRKRGYQEVIIHTGQHFDENMSDIFFDELEIPKPDENLHVSGGSHSEMTARIMQKLEPKVVQYNPKVVILYGDTNSTLAAALVVRKMNIPIVHIEAGIRTRAYSNPEEVNRVVVDHVSSLLCAPDMEAKENLKKENLDVNSYFTGDVMYDTFLYHTGKMDSEKVLSLYGIEKKKYILMTWHRQENTSDVERMKQILNMIGMIQRPVICPMHPRTREKLKEYGLLEQTMKLECFHIIEPVGYLEMMALAFHSSMIVTDSGGLSKESFFVGVRCMFMLDMKGWTDLERIGWIKHMDKDNQKNIQIIEDCLTTPMQEKKAVKEQFYGDGHASAWIIDLIEELMDKIEKGELEN